jgi:hypothetical protein
MRVRRRAVAALLLGSILACSGLGLCWVRFAPARASHDCCEQERSAASAKACASVVTLVVAAVVISPSEAAFPVTLTLPAAAAAAPCACWHAVPCKAPPLVLRI